MSVFDFLNEIVLINIKQKPKAIDVEEGLFKDFFVGSVWPGGDGGSVHLQSLDLVDPLMALAIETEDDAKPAPTIDHKLLYYTRKRRKHQ